jgi:hypothetical protein
MYLDFMYDYCDISLGNFRKFEERSFREIRWSVMGMNEIHI